MISDIAQQAVTALGLIPDKDVLLDGIAEPDWDGKPKILIMTSPASTEDATQCGIVSATSTLDLYSVAKTRQEAWDIVQKAAHAVYAKFEDLEKQPSASGIFCITRTKYDVVQTPNRKAFEALFSFTILHKFTL